MLKSLFPKKKTFKPVKKFQPGTKLHALHKYVKATLKRTLGAENLHEAVRLPDGEDLNEWIAVNTIDFFNTISLLYGSMSEFCTAESCPIMSAGPRFEYQWADGVKQKRPKRCSAPEYVEHLMSWVQSELDNTELFPTQIGVPFRTDFKDRCRNIMRRLFRVYAHLYHHHLEHVVGCGAEPHLNTCFKHFMLFTNQFDLVARKEQEPLAELIASFGIGTESAKGHSGGGGASRGGAAE